jgi:adenylate cyclase
MENTSGPNDLTEQWRTSFLQDDVNAKIVEALVGRLTPVAPRKRSKNVEAHDLCVRARLLTEESPQTAREAYLLLKRINQAGAVLCGSQWASCLQSMARLTHFGEPETPNRAMAVALAEKAVELDPSDAGCRYFLGTILAYERRWQES